MWKASPSEAKEFLKEMGFKIKQHSTLFKKDNSWTASNSFIEIYYDDFDGVLDFSFYKGKEYYDVGTFSFVDKKFIDKTTTIGFTSEHKRAILKFCEALELELRLTKLFTADTDPKLKMITLRTTANSIDIPVEELDDYVRIKLEELMKEKVQL